MTTYEALKPIAGPYFLNIFQPSRLPEPCTMFTYEQMDEKSTFVSTSLPVKMPVMLRLSHSQRLLPFITIVKCFGYMKATCSTPAISHHQRDPNSLREAGDLSCLTAGDHITAPIRPPSLAMSRRRSSGLFRLDETANALAWTPVSALSKKIRTGAVATVPRSISKRFCISTTQAQHPGGALRSRHREPEGARLIV